MAASKFKENMAIVLRFLKETKMLKLWKEYVNYCIITRTRFVKKRWYDEYYVEHILGNTNFTNFVRNKLEERDGVHYEEGESIYLRFVYWLMKMNKLEHYSIYPTSVEKVNKLGELMSNHIKIDPITNKTDLIFHESILKF